MKKRLIALLLVVALLIPAAVASAATWYRVNTTSLRVRFLPDTSAKEIGSYRKDYACTVSKTTKDGWSYVSFVGGTKGYADGKGLNAKFNEVDGILVYDESTLYICDAQNCLIRKVSIR